MSVTAWTEPSTIISDPADGTEQWINPGSAYASDNINAVTLTGWINNELTHHLKATNHGISIPGDATVDGIEVVVEARVGFTCDKRTHRVSIVKGGVTGAVNRDTLQGQLTNVDVQRVYGGPTDKWGESWTPADVNAADFGCIAQFKSYVTNPAQGIIDWIGLRVYYTEASADAAIAQMCQIVGT